MDRMNTEILRLNTKYQILYTSFYSVFVNFWQFLSISEDFWTQISQIYTVVCLCFFRWTTKGHEVMFLNLLYSTLDIRYSLFNACSSAVLIPTSWWLYILITFLLSPVFCILYSICLLSIIQISTFYVKWKFSLDAE